MAIHKKDTQVGPARHPDIVGKASAGGQVLLIVVLIIVVASIIGLSVVSRSITGIRTSTEETESQKALSAAEAGIERALQTNIPETAAANLTNNSKYETIVTEIRNAAFAINGGLPILKDEGVDIWLIGRNPDGTPNYASTMSPQFFNLYWGSPSEGACGGAAIEVITVTNTAGTIRTYRHAYDSCTTSTTGTPRRTENNFTQSQFGAFPKDYDNDGNMDLTFGNVTPEVGANSDLVQGINNIVFMRVIPIYKNTVIGVSACNHAGQNCTNLPSQGYKIESTGESPVGAGSEVAKRKITVFKGYPQTYLPYLSYGLFVVK